MLKVALLVSSRNMFDGPLFILLKNLKLCSCEPKKNCSFTRGLNSSDPTEWPKMHRTGKITETATGSLQLAFMELY